MRFFTSPQKKKKQHQGEHALDSCRAQTLPARLLPIPQTPSGDGCPKSPTGTPFPSHGPARQEQPSLPPPSPPPNTDPPPPTSLQAPTSPGAAGRPLSHPMRHGRFQPLNRHLLAASPHRQTGPTEAAPPPPQPFSGSDPRGPRRHGRLPGKPLRGVLPGWGGGGGRLESYRAAPASGDGGRTGQRKVPQPVPPGPQRRALGRRRPPPPHGHAWTPTPTRTRVAPALTPRRPWAAPPAHGRRSGLGVGGGGLRGSGSTPGGGGGRAVEGVCPWLRRRFFPG